MSGEVIPLGTRLRERRSELGWSQAQAARELDVARTAYRLWEMEAARPAPDRWRAIANWLGISISAVLLAADLIEGHEPLDAQRAAEQAGLTTTQWDEDSNASAGDYFSQERSLIADHAAAGSISPEQATNLRRVLARVQDAALDDKGVGSWHPGHFRKRFPASALAPSLSRLALAATAVGIPAPLFTDATLVVSELVTNAVQHSGSPWVDVAITAGTDALRIEVTDAGTGSIVPRTADLHGGWGLTVVARAATRWGVERNRSTTTIWVEFDVEPAN